MEAPGNTHTCAVAISAFQVGELKPAASAPSLKCLCWCLGPSLRIRKHLLV